MRTSNIIHEHSKLHVYLTQASKKTRALEVVRRLAFTMYDRDVMIDLSGIPGWNESNIIVLLTIDILLREAGHRLILQGVPGDLKTTLDTLGLAKTLTIHEACQSSLSYDACNCS